MTDSATADRTATYESATHVLAGVWGDTTALMSRVNGLRDRESSASPHAVRLRADLDDITQILAQVVSDLSAAAATAKTQHDLSKPASAIQEAAAEAEMSARVLLDYADMRTGSAYVLYEHCTTNLTI